jgi:imidazoleglycerol phosphate synthase cyclase subunit
MLKIRVIPVLLLRNGGLEKSIQFRDYVYIGCPINTARVFNGMNADELILLDITATNEGRIVRPEVVSEIAEECCMPITVGGGIDSINDIRRLLEAGADRIVINTAAAEGRRVVAEGADRFGSQCIVVSIDTRRMSDRSYEVFTHGGKKPTGLDPVQLAVEMEKEGAGEILLTSIDRDGTMSGYDIELIRKVSDSLTIPLIACGGAGSVAHLADAVNRGRASAVACGAFFLFYGARRTVLITYPTDEDLRKYLKSEQIRNKDRVAFSLKRKENFMRSPLIRKESKRCRRCIMDVNIPGVLLNAEGICNHCQIHDRLENVFPVGTEGQKILEAITTRIKEAGKGDPHDCVVGVSGGRDTSYCLYMTKTMGLRPLAVHFDNGWDSMIAKENIKKLCDNLKVDLQTVIADWEESRELTNCTIRASVPYIDLTDDAGIASALYRTAAREGIRYIILSHSFREEGITPLKWNYFDGRYIRSLIKRFCRIKLKHFKNVDIHHMFYWIFIQGIRVVNITNYYNDAGDHVERLLKEKFDWVDTGQHHFDNEIFALVYYYARHKFSFDWRVVELSAKVRTGTITRERALAAMQEVPFFENKELVAYCLKKQRISAQEWEEIMAAPRKYFYDYPTWYPYLKLFKYGIKWISRANILPGQAYEKYFEV